MYGRGKGKGQGRGNFGGGNRDRGGGNRGNRGGSSAINVNVSQARFMGSPKTVKKEEKPLKC